MSGFRYEWATFRISLGERVRVEVSIRGCEDQKDLIDPEELGTTGEICQRLAKAIGRIKGDIELKGPQP